MFLRQYKFFLSFILSFSFLFASSAPAGASIYMVRDSEVEEVLDLIARPLLQKVGLYNTKIYVINDESLNAFAYIDGNIYINSGMINKFADVNVVRGVIAHEIGHISERHIIRQQENIENFQKILFSSIAIGIAGALLSNQDNAGDIMAASYGFGSHIFERNLLHYSRTYEAAADHVAFKLLEETNNSVSGLIDFFNFTKSTQGAIAARKYELTHPLSFERLRYARMFYESSKSKNLPANPYIQKKYARMRAKLRAFTIGLDKISNIEAKFDDQENSKDINNYMLAVANFRLSKFDKSIYHIDELLRKYPNDAFYNELKAEILLYFGKRESIKYYDIACSQRETDLLMKLSRALAGMSLYKKPDKLKNFANDLKLILDLQKDDNLTALYYMASYYQKISDQGNYLLYSGLYASKNNRKKQARVMVNAALKLLPKGSTSWYKASDLLETL